MEKVRVAVEAHDMITRIGLIGTLRIGSKVHILGPNEHHRAQVLVFATDRFHLAATRLRRDASRVRIPIVLVADNIEENELLTAVECGVSAVLIRSSVSVEKLTDYVLTAANGGAMLSPDMLGGLFKQIHHLMCDLAEQRNINQHHLKHREIEVLRLLADGHSTREISDKLSYSERTIKNILSTTITRLGVRNRAHAVAYALRAGLL